MAHEETQQSHVLREIKFYDLLEEEDEEVKILAAYRTQEELDSAVRNYRKCSDRAPENANKCLEARDMTGVAEWEEREGEDLKSLSEYQTAVRLKEKYLSAGPFERVFPFTLINTENHLPYLRETLNTANVVWDVAAPLVTADAGLLN
ncbi:MAG: uncharacterized protein A8A55_2471 [Amphiamblys sp. WSBS2006]|nr:MAG: uncharacterized protein A8A55_2471 [Amphiamblys sp. WSBS2006]